MINIVVQRHNAKSLTGTVYFSCLDSFKSEKPSCIIFLIMNFQPHRHFHSITLKMTVRLIKNVIRLSLLLSLKNVVQHLVFDLYFIYL